MTSNTSVEFVFTGNGQSIPSNVTYVRFHPSVVEVCFSTFSDYKSLTEVILNDGLREIGRSAFKGCSSLKSINLLSTIAKIDDFAFYNCINLRDIVLSEGLRKIGEYAFCNCKSLQKITIPSTITKISCSAFRDCTDLSEVVLNDGLKKIEHSIFSYCTALQSITIPSTVIEIGRGAFYNCTSLERITIPSTMSEIWNKAFDSCTNLREVVLHNKAVRITEDWVFNNNYKGIQISVNAFQDCTLERFKFPDLFTRLDSIIQAGQRDIEAKVDDIHAVEWRGGELVIPAMRREIEDDEGEMVTVVNVDEEKLDKIVGLIRYYEIKEATTLFELALWKAWIDQVEDSNPMYREACRIDVPGPVKETILKYLL